MKKSILLLLLGLACYACKNTPEVPGNNPTEQSGITQDTNKLKEEAAKSGVEISKTDLVGMGKGSINGSNVSMRNGPTIKSEKTGTFEDKEPVEVIGYKNVQNEGEAILAKDIALKGNGGTIRLPKGKAVIVENFNAETNTYQVSYEDPKKGVLNAEIDASAALTITYATWFNVKRQNGETGWVLGKFLKNN